jgi:hypothetical protein
MFYYVTAPAQEFINSLPKDEKVIAFQEDLDHDGYDRYGPKSDLWDLFLITKKGDDYIFYSLYWENWFRREPHVYELNCRNYLKNIVSQHYNWDKIKEMCSKNPELIRYIKSIDHSFYRKECAIPFGKEIEACHTSNRFYIVLSKQRYQYQNVKSTFEVMLFDKTTKKNIDTLSYDDFRKKYNKLRANKWLSKTIKLLDY